MWRQVWIKWPKFKPKIFSTFIVFNADQIQLRFSINTTDKIGPVGWLFRGSFHADQAVFHALYHFGLVQTNQMRIARAIEYLGFLTNSTELEISNQRILW